MSGPSPQSRSYPKPTGWKGGPDGRIIRQGSGSRGSINIATDTGEEAAREDRRWELDFSSADFGSSDAGQHCPLENYYECYEDGDA